MAERPGPDPDVVRETMQEEREEIEREAGNGPDTSELDQDPAYNPDDEELKDLKGG
jgi:hypothetical protein